MNRSILGPSFTTPGGRQMAVFTVLLTEEELGECEELRRRGGAFRLTVTSLQATLDEEPKMVSIERMAYTFDGLLEGAVGTE